MSIKQCPYCAEDIEKEAIICKHCESNLKEAFMGENRDEEPINEEIFLVLDAYWDVPAKKGNILCLEEKIVIKEQGIDILLGATSLGLIVGAVKTSNVKKSLYYDVILQDPTDLIIEIKDVVQIKVKKNTLLRDKVTIIQKKKRMDLYIPRKAELLKQIYPNIVI